MTSASSLQIKSFFLQFLLKWFFFFLFLEFFICGDQGHDPKKKKQTNKQARKTPRVLQSANKFGSLLKKIKWLVGSSLGFGIAGLSTKLVGGPEQLSNFLWKFSQFFAFAQVQETTRTRRLQMTYQTTLITKANKRTQVQIEQVQSTTSTQTPYVF